MTLFLIFMIPIVQLLMFGYAINTSIRDIPTALLDFDQTEASRNLAQSFEHTGYFRIMAHPASDLDLDNLIVKGTVKVGIKIPNGYSAALLQKQPKQVLVLVDGSDSTVASQAVTAANAVGLIASFSQISSSTKKFLVDIRPRVLFNPDSRSPNFMVPGLVAIILQITTTLLTAFSIVRERENQTIEQLFVTPVQPLGLMVGKLFPYMVIGFGQGLTVLTIMGLIFHVPIHGSLWLLLALLLLFLFPALALGLLISTKAENQVQAIQLAYFIILPSVLLSGFMFPRESMPALMNWVGYIIPATYFIEIMRGIVLRGASLMDLWPNVLALTILGTLLLILAVRRFRKTIG